MYPQTMFWAKIRKISFFFLMKFFIFYNFKNLCILHGHVFVMTLPTQSGKRLMGRQNMEIEYNITFVTYIT